MKLSDWARKQGVSYITAGAVVQSGQASRPRPSAPNGDHLGGRAISGGGRTMLYARVLSADWRRSRCW